MSLYVDFLSNQTNHFFVSVCQSASGPPFPPVKTKHSPDLPHDTSVTEITSTALVACKGDIPVGILNSCVLVNMCVCVSLV